jgi:hypothetical protein
VLFAPFVLSFPSIVCHSDLPAVLAGADKAQDCELSSDRLRGDAIHQSRQRAGQGLLRFECRFHDISGAMNII